MTKIQNVTQTKLYTKGDDISYNKSKVKKKNQLR